MPVDVDYAVVSRARISYLGYPPLLPALIADDGAELARLLARVRETERITSVDMSLPDPGGRALTSTGACCWSGRYRTLTSSSQVWKKSCSCSGATITSAGAVIFRTRSHTHIQRWRAKCSDMGNSAVVGIKPGDYGIYIHTSSAENANRLARLPIELMNGQPTGLASGVRGECRRDYGRRRFSSRRFLTAMLKGLSVDDAARWHVRLARAMSKRCRSDHSGVQSWA
ncbi:MAG: hypothetical protein U0703_16315 [Anaerolineae bacterium]